MAEYVTVQGDTWDSVSFKVYGTEKHMNVLMAANPDHLRTVIFGAGVRLNVPEVEPQEATDLPPWRRGMT